MSGKIGNRLPFDLPAGDSLTENCKATLSHKRQPEDISSEHLQNMEQIYIPKFKSLSAVYEMEKEKARLDDFQRHLLLGDQRAACS